MQNLLDFIRETNLYRKFEVDSLLFAEFKCPADESKSNIWWHNNFFAYILAGETLLKTRQQEYLLKPGECIFARRGSVITRSKTRDEFCELLIFVPDNFIKTVIHKHKMKLSIESTIQRPDIIIPLSTDPILLSYFQSLLSYFSLPDPPPEALLKHKFEELIMHIVSRRSESPLKNYFNEICTTNKPSIREIMDSNFSSNLSLEEFARLCCRSLSGFKREFRGLYHTSPGKWLKERRLEYSRYLLQHTMMSIEDVAFESGFVNRSHFIRVFRNKYGITPGRFHFMSANQAK